MGRRGGRAASLLNSVEDGQDLPGACSLTRPTDYHRRQPMPGNQYTGMAKGGEIFAPCAKSVFLQKK